MALLQLSEVSACLAAHLLSGRTDSVLKESRLTSRQGSCFLRELIPASEAAGQESLFNIHSVIMLVVLKNQRKSSLLEEGKGG